MLFRSVYDMSQAEMKKNGIELLPGDLLEAIWEMEQDTLVMQTLGAHIGREYAMAKRQEWEQFRTAVTDWELAQYLYRI